MEKTIHLNFFQTGASWSSGIIRHPRRQGPFRYFLLQTLFEQLRDKTRREDPEREETARRSCEDEGGSRDKLRNDRQANVERFRETVWFASRLLNGQRQARNDMEKKIN